MDTDDENFIATEMEVETEIAKLEKEGMEEKVEEMSVEEWESSESSFDDSKLYNDITEDEKIMLHGVKSPYLTNVVTSNVCKSNVSNVSNVDHLMDENSNDSDDDSNFEGIFDVENSGVPNDDPFEKMFEEENVESTNVKENISHISLNIESKKHAPTKRRKIHWKMLITSDCFSTYFARLTSKEKEIVTSLVDICEKFYHFRKSMFEINAHIKRQLYDDFFNNIEIILFKKYTECGIPENVKSAFVPNVLIMHWKKFRQYFSQLEVCAEGDGRA